MHSQQRDATASHFGRLASWLGAASLILLATCLIWADLASGAPRRRRTAAQHHNAAQQARQQAMVRAAQAQIEAAQKVLAAAQSKGNQAQAELRSALARMQKAADDFRDAQSTTRHLAKELAEIESDILDEQPPDSPFAKAAQRVSLARQKLSQLEEQVLSQESVARELEALSGAERAQRRTAILSAHPDYKTIKEELDQAVSEMDRIRRQLFQNDPDWREASKALQQARDEEKAAQAQIKSAGHTKAEAGQSVASADQAIAAARAAIAQAEAVLRAARANPQGKAPSNNNKKPNGGNKNKK
jgi:chromosome segregation ATPase